MEKAPFDIVTLAVPVFVLLIVLEIVLGRLKLARANYETRDTGTSLAMGLGSTVAGALTAGIVGAATIWVWRHRIFDIPMTAWWAWVALFFLEDLTYYWFHRLSHERRFWWAAHVNHHSSQHYNLSTALRQTWTGGINGSWLLWLPLALVGFPPAMIFVQKGVSLVYQFWIHTEAIRRFPAPIEYVFNTPSHHRVHHARNPRYLDRNYAGILIIWDRMFGSFEAELDEEPCRYGVVKNLGDFNLLRVAFHEWIAIANDLRTARSPKDVLMYVFGPPGWSPDGSRDTAQVLRARWEARVSSPAALAEPAPSPAVSPATPA